MDLSWGYDYSHSNHSNYTPYHHPEFTGTIDCRISTLGIDIETPVEWTCEDLQEIMNEDANSFETLLRSQSDKDFREETPAFQHILSDLLRTESDFMKIDLMSKHTHESERGSKSWHYANQFNANSLQSNDTNGFCTSTVELPHEMKQDNVPLPEFQPNGQATEHCMYPLVTYDPEPPVPTQPAILRRAKVKLEFTPTNEIPVPFASCSPPLPAEESKKGKAITKNQFNEESNSPKPLVETPKSKCPDSPESMAPSPVPSPSPVMKQIVTTEVPIPKSSPPPKPDTTVELGPYCKAAGIISSDLDQTSLPDGRTKLPAHDLKNGIIVEMYGFWRQVRSPRRTFVRFLGIYFDIKFLDDNNPTVVDRLFRRVIAPLLVQRTELIKNSGISITRQLGNQPKSKVRKSHDALVEFDSAVFVIPDFVTDPFNRRTACAGRTAAAATKDRKTPPKKPPKPTQAQQLVELQARFDAFRRVQRKHNLAFLRQLNRMQTKVNKLTHRLSKRLSSGRKRSISNASN